MLQILFFLIRAIISFVLLIAYWWFMVFMVFMVFPIFLGYLGYLGASELGITSEFIRLFCAMIGFSIGINSIFYINYNSMIIKK